MKKTLTVNLGGTVFHIDEDAYELLDKYLSNLRIHFRNEEGSEEIMNDFEMRISELLNERIRLGYGVITITEIESVIKRMGSPEELFEDAPENNKQRTGPTSSPHDSHVYTQKRLFRNPDDRILGGVAGGLAAYLDWDPTLVRLLIILLTAVSAGFPFVIIYFVMWIIVPMARTATEKLQMRGETITIENIGKTVSNSFESVKNTVNDYANSPKTRSTLQRIADGFIEVVGVLVKIIAVLLGLAIFPPLLLGLFIVFIILIALLTGGVGALYSILPFTSNFSIVTTQPYWVISAVCICTLFVVGIPLLSVIYAICNYFFKYKPVSHSTKWTLLILWIISLVLGIILSTHYHIPVGFNWDSSTGEFYWNSLNIII